jgi:ATP-dependent DNA helicase RecG
MRPTRGDPQSDTQDDTQGDTQGGTQSGTQEENLDKWVENQIRKNPQISTEELSKMSKKGIATIKRHIAKMPHIRYVGSGYSGHWEVDAH